MDINWNKKAIQTLKKKQFIDSHQIYADHVDLGKVWEDHQEKKAEAKAPAEKEKTE